MKNFILGVLAAIFIGGLVFIAYRYGQQQKVSISDEPQASSTPLIVSNPTPESSPLLKEVPEDDSDLIEQALLSKNNWEKGFVTITISTNNGKYASGTVTADGGGGYFYAAKVNGEWKIVADGNGMIMCSSMEDYPDYPKTLIPECYDLSSETSIKR